MRATVSFDIEVERVSAAMMALVKLETDAIRGAAHVIEVATKQAGPTEVGERIEDSIETLSAIISQLQQYQVMLASFQKARLETVLPQPATGELPTQEVASGEVVRSPQELALSLKNLNRFGEFIDRLNEEEEEGEEDELHPEEG
jgi:hypothetical protein